MGAAYAMYSKTTYVCDFVDEIVKETQKADLEANKQYSSDHLSNIRRKKKRANV